MTMVALIVACGSGGDDGLVAGDGSSIIIATVTPEPGPGTPTAIPGTPPAAATDLPATESPTVEGAAPEPTAAEVAPTETPVVSTEDVLSGFIYPIAGACLPQGQQLMPNAPRAYRDGTHEGVDFYGVDNCTAIWLGTPVMAAKAGTVVRVDHGYVPLTPATLNAILANPTTPESFDAFRGQQVWIDHGGGVVTYYCHLSGVVGTLQVGQSVAQGEVIAYVGESGTPGSVTTPGSEYHLHWEVRIGDSYLGAGLDPDTVRAQYLALFGQ